MDICGIWKGCFRVSLVFALLALLTGCGDEKLFEAPPRGATTDVVPPPVSDSTVTLLARIPYDALQQAVAAKIPASMPFDGNGHIACVGVPRFDPGVGSHRECHNVLGLGEICVDVPNIPVPSIKWDNQQCADYSWHADVSKQGGFSVARAADAVHLQQGLRVQGQAGVSGDLARLLSLNAKSFAADAVPAIDLKFDMSEQWCPLVSVTPTGRWVSDAKVELVGSNCIGFDFGPLGHPQVCAGPVNLGLADVLNGELDKHRGEIQTAVSSALPCDVIRTKIAEQWHPISIKADRNEQLFLNVVPTGAAFSGLVAEDQAVKLVVQVTAKTSVGPAGIATQPVPLPPLGHAAANHSGVVLNVQVAAPYSLLKSELATYLKGKDFKQQTPAGDVKVHIDDVDIYPSQTSIAIGLKIRADLPGHWFDTSGWVYLSGRTVAVPANKSVEIQDIHFATVIDNDFWKIVEALFSQQILGVLRDHSKVDLGKPMDDAAVKIKDGIAQANVPGLKITADTPAMELTDISIGKDNLVASARLSMNFDMELSAALLDK